MCYLLWIKSVCLLTSNLASNKKKKEKKGNVSACVCVCEGKTVRTTEERGKVWWPLGENQPGRDVFVPCTNVHLWISHKKKSNNTKWPPPPPPLVDPERAPHLDSGPQSTTTNQIEPEWRMATGYKQENQNKTVVWFQIKYLITGWVKTRK